MTAEERASVTFETAGTSAPPLIAGVPDSAVLAGLRFRNIGPAIMSGGFTCSYRFCLPISPWLPSASPLSAAKTMIVLSAWPDFSSAARIRPICSSRCVIIP